MTTRSPVILLNSVKYRCMWRKTPINSNSFNVYKCISYIFKITNQKTSSGKWPTLIINKSNAAFARSGASDSGGFSAN